jgi:hypothetical protein
MNEARSTRECTQVFLWNPGDMEEVAFTTKEYSLVKEFTWERFKSNRDLHIDSVQELLEAKLDDLIKLKEEAKQREKDKKKEEVKQRELARLMEEGKKRKKKTKKDPDSKPLTWEQKVNKKRRLVADFLQQQAQPNLAQVCRDTGCSYSLVKRVADDLAFNGEVSPYVYPNMKTCLQLAQLSKSISQVNGSFACISDLKRFNPTFSRKYIAKQLKATGLRYQLVRKNELKPKQPTYNDKEVLKTVRHLAQSLRNNKVETFYIDEVHFPLCQTSERHWTKDQFQGHDLYYNRRLAYGVEKLSVIAMCSTERFVAVQVFKRDISGQDFLYFLQEALKLVPSSAKVTVLADNATWHTAEVVVKTKAASAIEFNARGLFQANMIENAFSFVRAEFRKRQNAENDEEEARLLLRIFFDPRNEHRFAGIFRNHLRSLLSLLVKHYTAVQSRQRGPYRSKGIETTGLEQRDLPSDSLSGELSNDASFTDPAT